MNGTTDVNFEQLGELLASDVRIPAAQLRELAHSRDLIGLGMLAADVRARRLGTHGTFVRVQDVDVTAVPDGISSLGLEMEPQAGTFVMGELRLTGRPASLDVAQTIVAASAAQARVPVSGWSIDELGTLGPLADVAPALKAAGLHAVATARLDRLSAADLDALAAADLPLQSVTLGEPLDGDALVEALEQLRGWQAGSGVVRACVPLPVEVPPAHPTTGYDDMRHVALARLVLDNVAHIQAHWTRMGAKLSQSCLLFGADDIDAVPALDPMPHGPRRAVLEEVRRNVTAASLTPVERDGGWTLRESLAGEAAGQEPA